MEAVQFIKVENQGLFVCNFGVKYLDANGYWLSAPGYNSNHFNVNEVRDTPDLVSIGVPADAKELAPNVHMYMTSGGHDRLGEPQVTYAKNGKTAVYIASGNVGAALIITKYYK